MSNGETPRSLVTKAPSARRADVIYFPEVRIPLLTRLLSPRRERAERCVSIYPITGPKYECVYAVVWHSLLPYISTDLTRHSRAVGCRYDNDARQRTTTTLSMYRAKIPLTGQRRFLIDISKNLRRDTKTLCDQIINSRKYLLKE